jgi:hypothetical membrane protein
MNWEGWIDAMTMSPMSVTTSLPAAPAARAATGRSFWRRDIYALIALACILFVILTAVAMLVYPGGTIVDSAAQGYRFFENYFSDLGLTRSRSGAANVAAMLLFSVALVCVALALGAFFPAFTQFCAAAPRALRLSRRAALVGSITCMSFIGVAVSPRDLAYPEHIAFELVAFPSFLAAAALEIAALRALERTAPPGLPRRFLWVFVGLAAALAAYIALLAFGPSDRTLVGERIQVSGQKIVVYAAIAAILLQAIQARRMASRTSAPSVPKRRRRHAGAAQRRVSRRGP